ncbi:unnamed protein product [Owenia fusiformis]|uniref:Uncharacterized protein n=1 Tax=Owenia fusiformis TaxID=6347 RepID=A0A8J1XUJ2_OWEFU|nr:unnamed protein product [Owenia fusiformis]
MAGITKEIVTLQVGHFSNFVGTHWWNLQDASFVYDPKEAANKEVNTDVMFREGQNLMGEVTYTPRLIGFDLKGSLNTLKQDGNLYDLNLEEDLKWAADVTQHKVEVGEKNDFLLDLERQQEAHIDGSERKRRKVEEDEKMEIGDVSKESSPTDIEEDLTKKLYHLEKNIKVWSDFLKIYLHPKSLYVLQDYSHNSENEPFDIFSYGSAIYNTRTHQDEIDDKLHFFLEECDHLQGFHVLTDTFDGFGGLSTSLLEHLEDEYSSKGIFTFGLSPAHHGDTTTYQDSLRVINSVLTYNKAATHSSAFLPLSTCQEQWRKPQGPLQFPHTNFDARLAYHSSAVLAACLDTMSLPYRLDGSAMTMTHITDALTQCNRKVLTLNASFPFTLNQSQSLIGRLMELEDELPWQPLGPYPTSKSKLFSQSMVLRGIPPNRMKSVSDKDVHSVLGKCNDYQDLLQLYSTEMFPYTLNSCFVVKQPCKVIAPFPNIFRDNLTPDGQLSQTPRLPTVGVETVPIWTSLQSNPTAATMLNKLIHEAKRLDINKYHKFKDSGLEQDDYNEMLNSLEDMASNYSTQLME